MCQQFWFVASVFMNQRQGLEKISESSSPEVSLKGLESPWRAARNRVMANGMGESYLSYFKMDNHNDMIKSQKFRSVKNPSENETLSEKNNKIQTLQESIMKEMIKKTAREKAFQFRKNIDCKKQVDSIIVQFVRKCSMLSKDSIEHKRRVLELVIKANGADPTKRGKILILWLLEWVRSVFSTLSTQIRLLI